MGVVFKRNPRWHEQVRRSPEVRLALAKRAELVAREAQRLGREVASTYSTDVDKRGDTARVKADTAGVNAAAWIEFGTGAPEPTPAHAPLRRAAEHVGLKSGPQLRRGR